jgi:hypothetical protein
MQDYDLVLRLAALGSIQIIKQRLLEYRLHDKQSGAVPEGVFDTLRSVNGSRLALAEVLGFSKEAQILRNLEFTASQLARYSGLRRPRFEKARNLK